MKEQKITDMGSQSRLIEEYLTTIKGLEQQLSSYVGAVEVATEVVQVCGGQIVLRHALPLQEELIGQRVRVLVIKDGATI